MRYWNQLQTIFCAGFHSKARTRPSPFASSIHPLSRKVKVDYQICCSQTFSLLCTRDLPLRTQAAFYASKSKPIQRKRASWSIDYQFTELHREITVGDASTSKFVAFYSSEEIQRTPLASKEDHYCELNAQNWLTMFERGLYLLLMSIAIII